MKDLWGLESCPPHPGEILKEDILPHYQITRKDLAKHLGISTRRLSDLLHERCEISLDLAMRLGAAFGQGAHYWLGLQMQHNLWQAHHQDVKVRPVPRKMARRSSKPGKLPQGILISSEARPT